MVPNASTRNHPSVAAWVIGEILHVPAAADAVKVCKLQAGQAQPHHKLFVMLGTGPCGAASVQASLKQMRLLLWFPGEPEAKTWTAGMLKKQLRKPGLSSLFPGPAEPHAQALPADGSPDGPMQSPDAAAARPSRVPALSRLHVSDTDTAQGVRCDTDWVSPQDKGFCSSLWHGRDRRSCCDCGSDAT